MFAGNCYLTGEGEDTWAGAKSWCRNNNSASYLASIHSAAENDHIFDLLQVTGGKNGWIGYSDQAEDGKWVWTDGSTRYPYTHWNQGEPNGGSRENCAHMRTDGFWNDRVCTDKLPFVCKVGIQHYVQGVSLIFLLCLYSGAFCS